MDHVRRLSQLAIYAESDRSSLVKAMWCATWYAAGIASGVLIAVLCEVLAIDVSW